MTDVKTRNLAINNHNKICSVTLHQQIHFANSLFNTNNINICLNLSNICPNL